MIEVGASGIEGRRPGDQKGIVETPVFSTPALTGKVSMAFDHV